MNRSEIAGFIRENLKRLSADAVDRQYALQGEFFARFGEQGRKIGLRDAEYNFHYLAVATEFSEADLFVDYALWLKTVFDSLRFPAAILVSTLECVRATLSAALSEVDAAGSIVDAALRAVAAASAHPAEHGALETLGALRHGRYAPFLEAVLQGDRRVAASIVRESADGGTTLKEFYLTLFQPIQYEIGWLWQTGKISVSKEHTATAIVQFCIAQLYPRFFAATNQGSRRLLAAAVENELHEIGIRMVADIFESEGWNTRYIGANAPTPSLLDTIRDFHPDVVALSATIPLHLDALSRLIGSIRTLDGGKDMTVLVGGAPFRTFPGLWKKMGADGTAADAVAALETASALLSQRTR